MVTVYQEKRQTAKCDVHIMSLLGYNNCHMCRIRYVRSGYRITEKWRRKKLEKWKKFSNFEKKLKSEIKLEKKVEHFFNGRKKFEISWKNKTVNPTQLADGHHPRYYSEKILHC